jgi:hypothetical protein
MDFVINEHLVILKAVITFGNVEATMSQKMSYTIAFLARFHQKLLIVTIQFVIEYILDWHITGYISYCIFSREPLM